MAKKDFDKFFEEFYEQYIFVLDRTKQIVKEFENNPTEEMRQSLENFKLATTPIVNNYYIYKKVKELLDKPVRKEKHKIYNKQLKIVQDEEQFTPASLSNQNKKSINTIKEILKESNE